jgi:hypothetical protein
MRSLNLHITSEIEGGRENVWVTSDEITILLIIDIDSGAVKGFSCRLGEGVVAEMGWAHHSFPMPFPTLCIFTEDAEHNAGPRYYCNKRESGWNIES